MHTLRLDSNSIEEVPWSVLMSLSCLTNVNFSYNRIKHLPDELSKWDAIARLDLSHNQITTLSPLLWTLLYPAQHLIDIDLGTLSPKMAACGYMSHPPITAITTAVRDFFGHRLPEYLKVAPGLDPNNRDAVTIVHYPGDQLATLHISIYIQTYNVIKEGTVRIKKEFIRRPNHLEARGPWESRRRAVLDDNPVCDRCDLEQEASRWRDEHNSGNASPCEERSEDAEKLRREARTSTRPERREDREKSKEYRDARDWKRDV